MDIGTKTGVCIQVPPDNKVHLVKVNGAADEINIGGPLTNKYVHNYLSEYNKFIFYKKYVDKVKLDHVIENDCIRETNDNGGRYFTIGENEYYIDNETDYLLLIRFRKLNGKK